MAHKSISNFTLDEAKELVNALIVGNITQFLDSVEQAVPSQGYGVFSSKLKAFNQQIQNCSASFLTEDEIDQIGGELLDTFTWMNPNIEKNLKKLFYAYKEVGDFLQNNKNAFEFRLLDFDLDNIQKLKDVNKSSNIIMTQLKNNNYADEASLHGIFSIHSSRVETSESYFLDELRDYKNKMNEFTRNTNIQYSVKFDPIEILSVGTKIVKRDKTTYYTEARAIRHLIAHHHYKLENDGKACTIHFKSPNNPQWKFDYDRKFTCEEFFNFVAELDLFYKSAIQLLMSIQLLGTLRQCFIKKS